MTRTEKIRYLILRSVGNFLFLFGVYGVVMTFGPAVWEEGIFRINQARGVSYVVSDGGGGTGFARASELAGEQVLSPRDPFFSIIIPKIGASAPVVPNVDPVNEAIYVAALQEGIAHAKGTVFPGMQGVTFLFAHSTDSIFNVGRYNAVFYLLKNLTVGDQVVVFFQNQRYNYIVRETMIVDPDKVEYLTKAQEKDTQELVLQTCWPPGTTWKRFIVVATPTR
jgi:sortase A